MRESIDMDDVLKDLEADRRAGKLAKEMSSSCIRYSIDP